MNAISQLLDSLSQAARVQAKTDAWVAQIEAEKAERASIEELDESLQPPTIQIKDLLGEVNIDDVANSISVQQQAVEKAVFDLLVQELSAHNAISNAVEKLSFALGNTDMVKFDTESMKQRVHSVYTLRFLNSLMELSNLPEAIRSGVMEASVQKMFGVNTADVKATAPKPEPSHRDLGLVTAMMDRIEKMANQPNTPTAPQERRPSIPFSSNPFRG